MLSLRARHRPRARAGAPPISRARHRAGDPRHDDGACRPSSPSLPSSPSMAAAAGLPRRSTLLGWTEGFSIFGYPGILIAHVFLNAPFVARITLDGLNQVPAEHWRLATALGFTPFQIFRHLDWPVLRAELPGIAGLDLPHVLQELRHRAGARRRTEPLDARSGDLRGAQDRSRFRPRRMARPDPACDLPVDDGVSCTGPLPVRPSATRSAT